jgi:hypothetical protein
MNQFKNQFKFSCHHCDEEFSIFPEANPKEKALYQ